MKLSKAHTNTLLVSLLTLMWIVFGFQGCEEYFETCYDCNPGGNTLDKLIADLDVQITELVGDRYCTEDSQCAQIKYGHSPCGGPGGYLVYSTLVTDTDELESLTIPHAELTGERQLRDDSVGICVVEPPFESLVCAANTCGVRGLRPDGGPELPD